MELHTENDHGHMVGTANAEEFFHHLNLSKCSGSKTVKHDQNSVQSARKYPLTRYTHHALIKIKKCDAKETGDDASEFGNFKQGKPNSKKKRLTLAQKITELKKCDRSQDKAPAADLQNSPSKKLKYIDEEDESLRFKFHELKSPKKSVKDESEKWKIVIKEEIEKGTDHELLQREKRLMKDLKPPYRCTSGSCAAQFTDIEKFLRHIRNHGDSGPYACTRCDSNFKHRSDLASHLKRHLGVKNIKCEHCGKTFDKTRSLTSHLIVKHGKIDPRPRNFKCTECGDAFLSKVAVDRHMRWHTGYRPESCPFCGASFHTQYDLKQHLRVHSGEKPYSCDECKYTARTAQLLKRHKKIHTKEKPFSCKECDFSCSSSGSLKRHIRSHSGKKPYKCPYCAHRCANIENLRKHIKKVKKHKGLKIYLCSHCMSYSTDDSNEYLRHMKQYHFPYLDLKSATATKLSGILVEEETPDDHDSDEELADLAGNNIFESGPGSLLRNGALTQHSLALGGMQPNTLPELGLRSAMEGLSENDLLDSSVNDATRCEKGDIFLSSAATRDNHESSKQEAFSAPFDDVGTFTSGTETSETGFPQDPTTSNEGIAKTAGENPELNLNQGYVAVLVKWPSNEKVELQQGTTEGGVPLTLVINSNPVFLRPAEADNTHQSEDKNPSREVENVTGGKTYIMSQNGLVLSSDRSEVSAEKNAKASSEPVQNEPQTETFKTKSSINVSSKPPNIFAVSPEKITASTAMPSNSTCNI